MWGFPSYINNSGLTEENEQADRNGTISLGDVIQFDWTIYHTLKSKKIGEKKIKIITGSSCSRKASACLITYNISFEETKSMRWILKLWYWKKRCMYCG